MICQPELEQLRRGVAGAAGAVPLLPARLRPLPLLPFLLQHEQRFALLLRRIQLVLQDLGERSALRDAGSSAAAPARWQGIANRQREARGLTGSPWAETSRAFAAASSALTSSECETAWARWACTASRSPRAVV